MGFSQKTAISGTVAKHIMFCKKPTYKNSTRFNYNSHQPPFILAPGHWLSDVCSEAFHLAVRDHRSQRPGQRPCHQF